MLSHLRTLFTARPIMPYNGPTLATAIAASQNLASTSSKDEAQFANGCFWGTEVSRTSPLTPAGRTMSRVPWVDRRPW